MLKSVTALPLFVLSAGAILAAEEEPEAIGPTLVTPAAAAVTAQQASDWVRQLSSLLETQLQLLRAVQDPDSAQQAMSGLSDCLHAMRRLEEVVNEDALWMYIENHPDIKTTLMEQLQFTSAEFSRLKRASFYGCQALRQALAPQMEPQA